MNETLPMMPDLPEMPDLRGKLHVHMLLSDITWFRVGGTARYFYMPADIEDLLYFLTCCPPEMDIFVLGAGSNVLIRDGGFDGVVIKLGKPFATIMMNEEHQLTAGAAALDVSVARYAAMHGLTGMEFYAGIPGTIGGALCMNAGAYGSETADCFVSARALDRSGTLHELYKNDMGLSYRQNNVADDLIFLSATYQLRPDSQSEIDVRMMDIKKARETTQPIRMRTSGSTFRNPGGVEGAKAWQLVDASGCRGLREGDAQVSEQHCNFLINHGNARAADIENLGETVRRRVEEHSGVNLQWEIKRIGRAE